MSRKTDKASKFALALVLAFACLLAASCSTYISGRWITWKIPRKYNNPEVTYLKAKTTAMELSGLVNFTPFVISIDRQVQGYVFVMYAKDIDTVARVFVDGETGEGTVMMFEDEVVSAKGYDFLKNTDLIIDAERALNKVIKGDAKLKSPTESQMDYTYSSKFVKTKDDDTFRVIFGTANMEYDFAIKADINDSQIINREITPRDK